MKKTPYAIKESFFIQFQLQIEPIQGDLPRSAAPSAFDSKDNNICA
jgi:hypothetical protein